jgi:hypothetical protein
VASGRQRVLPWLTGGAFVANLLLSLGVLALALGLEILAASALLCRTAYAIALVLAARGITNWRRSQRIVLRLGVPMALCAVLALLLNHVFPDPDLRESALMLGIYILGIAPLVPGMLRAMHQARRLGRASV